MLECTCLLVAEGAHRAAEGVGWQCVAQDGQGRPSGGVSEEGCSRGLVTVLPLKGLLQLQLHTSRPWSASNLNSMCK